MVILCVLCLCLAGAFLYVEKKEQYVGAVVLKGLASLCFVLLGLRCSPGTHTAKLIVAGLILGFVADILLNLRWVVKEKGKLVFLHVIRDVCLLIFIADLIAAVLYPEGIPSVTTGPEEPFFLYGNVNVTVRYLFPGLLCSVLLDAKQNKKISVATAIFFAGYVFLCVRVYFMATGLCAMLFLVLWSLGSRILSKRVRLFTAIILLLYLVFELTIVVFQSQFVTDLIVAIFHKSPGFTGRNILWANCIRLFRAKPVFGYGAINRERLFYMIYSPSGAHNYFLDMLFQRGVVGAIPVFFFLLFPLFKKAPEKSKTEHYILVGFALAYILMFLFEPFYNVERFHITVFYVLNTLSEYASKAPAGAIGAK